MRRFNWINRSKPSYIEEKKDLPKRTGPLLIISELTYSSTAACAAAKRAIGTRNGEQLA